MIIVAAFPLETRSLCDFFLFLSIGVHSVTVTMAMMKFVIFETSLLFALLFPLPKPPVW